MVKIAPPLTLLLGILQSGAIIYNTFMIKKIIIHETGPFSKFNILATIDVVSALELKYCKILIILDPSNGTTKTNRSNKTITNSIIIAFNLLLKKPESFIP